VSSFHLVGGDIDAVVFQSNESVLSMGKIQFSRLCSEVETLWIIEFTFLEKGVAAVYRVNNCSREFFGIIVIGQDVK
jgi:hypothetical protein